MAEITSMTHMGQSGGAYPGIKPTAARNPIGGSAAVPGRRIERIADVSEIERALELAAVTLKPDELSARQLINRLMPSLYTLRKKGFSFAQMTGVLNRAIGGTGAQLQTATVKAYYNEFIVARLDECEQNLKAALEVTAEVEKITKAAPKELIAEAVGLKTAIGAKQPSAAGRLLNRPSAPAAETPLVNETGIVATQGRPIQALSPATPAEIAPPSEGTKPPSAAGFDPRIGEAGGGRKAMPAPMPVAFDDIPIASPISLTDQASPTNSPAILDAKKESPVAGQVMICTSTSSAETMHPSDSDMFDGIAREFFSSMPLEHPSIPGLMLTKEQRLHKERLKYTVDGAAKQESVQQMFNRLKWKKPERQTASRTQKDFVPMDSGLFKKTE